MGRVHLCGGNLMKGGTEVTVGGTFHYQWCLSGDFHPNVGLSTCLVEGVHPQVGLSTCLVESVHLIGGTLRKRWIEVHFRGGNFKIKWTYPLPGGTFHHSGGKLKNSGNFH